MPETQNIEYKSSWRDEFLRWICGFANAQGGILFIGKDDYGNVVGVNNSKKLLEDIPNKITSIFSNNDLFGSNFRIISELFPKFPKKINTNRLTLFN